jgi:hypothetical protein
LAFQLINTGTFPNDATGDPAQTAFIKINSNFGQLFGISPLTIGPPAFPPGGVALTVNAVQSSAALVVNGVVGSNAVTINNLAPTAAIAIQNAASGGFGVLVSASAGNVCNALQFGQAGQSLWALSEPAATSNFTITTGAVTPLTITNAGNVTIGAPSGGSPLSVTGVANSQTIVVTGSGTSGQSFGVNIRAGTTAADTALAITNVGVTQNLFQIFGDGGAVIGTPTGGDKGLGTLNCTGLFVNGVAVTVP